MKKIVLSLIFGVSLSAFADITVIHLNLKSRRIIYQDNHSSAATVLTVTNDLQWQSITNDLIQAEQSQSVTNN